MPKKVFVSGCFDLMHSGHIAFLQSAAKFGDLYVSVGSDKTLKELKNRLPIYSEDERLFMISAISCVKSAFIASGSGTLDFKKEIEEIRPDIFIVNSDGDKPEKRELCKKLSIEYMVLERVPEKNLTPRSTTELRKNFVIPYRIDLAGGWLDQPFVSSLYPGPVINMSIEPSHEFNLRSGMATSTRNKAIKLWGEKIPQDDPEELAKILFAYDNPPGSKEIAGSQDALGIMLPNINCLIYNGEYWPSKIETINDEETLQWLENNICLVPLEPREGDFKVLAKTNITPEGAKRLSDAASSAWGALKERDTSKFGKAMKESFEAQAAMFPLMSNPKIQSQINKYKDIALGWKLTGAGGGGYIVLITPHQVKDSIKVKIKRT